MKHDNVHATRNKHFFSLVLGQPSYTAERSGERMNVNMEGKGQEVPAWQDMFYATASGVTRSHALTSLVEDPG